MTSSQDRVVAVLVSFARSQDPRTGKPINLVEHNGDNHTWVTEQFTALKGWGNGYAWCAQGVSVEGWLAHVLDPADFSASAWGLTDHLKSLGHGLPGPEVGCVVSYAEGQGHTGTIMRHLGGTTWDVGEGNYGDRFMVVRRDLAAVPGGIHGYARFPGVDAELRALHDGAARPAPPPAPFGGHPLINWTGHTQVWKVSDEWVDGHGWRYRKAQVPAPQVDAAIHHAGQGIWHIGDQGAARLKSLHTIPYTG